MTKRLTKVCKPEKIQGVVVTPAKAVFRELLASKDHSSQAIKEAIDKEVSPSFQCGFYSVVIRNDRQQIIDVPVPANAPH